MDGEASEFGPTGRYEQIAAVRATPYRIKALASTLPAPRLVASVRGWTLVDGEIAEVCRAARAVGVVIRTTDGELLSIVVHGADGNPIGPLDASSGEADVRRATQACGLPDGAAVLHRALTSDSPRYDAAARLTDACRAMGLPLEFLAPIDDVSQSPAEESGIERESSFVEASAQADNGLVLVHAPALAAAADAPLTGQSAWTVPLGAQWSVHLWDGRGQRSTLFAAAMALAQPRRVTFAYWWPGATAGFVLTRHGRIAGAHQWGGNAPVTPEATAQAGRELAAEFRVPDEALTIVSLLRRTDLPPTDGLTALCRVIRAPADLVGRTHEELVAWATKTPGAVHTQRLTSVAAISHSLHEAPPDNVLEKLSRRRPAWYRLLNGIVAVGMGLCTAVLALLWHWGGMSGWWVLVGLFSTAGYAWGMRPRRHSRMVVNSPD